MAPPRGGSWDCAKAQAQVEAALAKHDLTSQAQTEVSCDKDGIRVTVVVAARPAEIRIVVDVRVSGQVSVTTDGDQARAFVSAQALRGIAASVGAFVKA